TSRRRSVQRAEGWPLASRFRHPARPVRDIGPTKKFLCELHFLRNLSSESKPRCAMEEWLSKIDNVRREAGGAQTPQTWSFLGRFAKLNRPTFLIRSDQRTTTF